MPFQFQTAGRIYFGCGEATRLGAVAAEWGRRVLFMTGRHPQRWDDLRAQLALQRLATTVWRIETEPTVEMIDRAVAAAREAGADLVVAVGGGSVIDAGKAVAAMLANDGALSDYLEIVGQGRALTQPSRPCIAVPTTAGTGAEVTRNAVLSAASHEVKVSLRSPFMMPCVAIVDPELTVAMPPAMTAGTGMDALTQLIEALVSSKANPLTDGICRVGLPSAARCLPRAFEDGRDLAAREGMSLASLCGGLALANAGLGAVHGLAGPLGGMIHAPHGMICAALLPAVMAANIEALRRQRPDSIYLQRYREVACLLTGRPDAGANEGVARVRALVDQLALPGLSTLGLKAAEFEAAVDKASRASSMKGNPVVLGADALEGILKSAF
jgi:alcohol dehydrogenase class IV